MHIDFVSIGNSPRPTTTATTVFVKICNKKKGMKSFYDENCLSLQARIRI